ncbi:MAG: hypothetical protein ACJ72T_11660 [Nitrososphaeraceae archaeon]
MLEDHIEYSLPGGALSEMIASRLIGKKLNQMFDYRHRITREDLRIHTAVNKIRGNDRPMTIAITAVKSNSNDKRSELLNDIVDIIKQPGKFNELITF